MGFEKLPEEVRQAARSIEHTKGERDVSYHIEALGIHPEDLAEGKKVLDLGASSYLAFADSMRQNGYSSDIISLSPAFYDGTRNIRANEEEIRRSVAGMGDALPFKDEMFDTIVILHVLQYLPNLERLKQLFDEALRVSKHGGVAYAGPLNQKEPGKPKRTNFGHFYDLMPYLTKEFMVAMLQGRADVEISQKETRPWWTKK